MSGTLLGGSPTRPALGTYVWAWFELPAPVPRRSQLESIKQRRRNPTALARGWQRRLDTGEVASRAELARELGVTRAHVTQVLGLLRLAPEAQDMALAFGDLPNGKQLGIHALRSLANLPVEQQGIKIEEYHNGTD